MQRNDIEGTNLFEPHVYRQITGKYLYPIHFLKIMDLLTKLHKKFEDEQEKKAPEPQEPKRKPNFFDKKRFVNYE